MTATPAWAVWGATAGTQEGFSVQQGSAGPQDGLLALRLGVTHRRRSGRHGGVARASWRPRRRRPLAPGYWSLAGSASCSPSPAHCGPALPAVETWGRPVQGSEGRGAGTGGTAGPREARGRVPHGGRKGLGRTVPYTAAWLAPGEFGLRVAAGGADELDLVSFGPAALTLGLQLLGPQLWCP